MRYPRRIRLLSAALALFSLLFMQLALAAYACPNLMPVPRAAMLDSSGQPMADCPQAAQAAQADRENPTLCYAESHKLTPSLDKPDAPSVMPFLATGLALPLLWPEVQASQPEPSAHLLHASGTSPPIAIRHCRFRL
jgi:hypothetical protein